MNNVQLIGRLTRDPELKYSTGENQTAICRFSLAINSGYGDNKRVDYPNIVVFGKRAENCQKYLTKGSQVGVVGRIQTGSYTNSNNIKVYTTDVIANEVQFLGTNTNSKSDSNGWVEPPPPQENNNGYPDGFAGIDDDIPF